MGLALPIVPIAVPFLWCKHFHIEDPTKVTRKRNYTATETIGEPRRLEFEYFVEKHISAEPQTVQELAGCRIVIIFIKS